MNKAFDDYLKSQAQRNQIVKEEINQIDSFINSSVNNSFFQINKRIEHSAAAEVLIDHYCSNGYDVKYFERSREICISWSHETRTSEGTVDFTIEANRNWFLTLENCSHHFIQSAYKEIDAAVEEGLFCIYKSYKITKLNIQKVYEKLRQDGYMITETYADGENVEIKIDWDFGK